MGEPGDRGLKATLAAGLVAARERTLALLAPLPDGELTRQVSPLMSPLVWDLAHLAWYEETWLLRRLAGALPVDPQLDDLYDAFRHPRAERRSLPLLEPERARAYAADVRERALGLLERVELDPGDPLRAGGFAFALVAQHEQQHVETMLQTLQLREEPYPLGPPAPAGSPVDPAEVLVPAGAFVLGTDSEPWAYDNERAAHELELPAFWIDAAPVTNRAYAAFVAGGGYDKRAWWSAEGWEHRQEADLEHPRFWRREGEGSWSRVRFGHVEPLPPDEPVLHVCFHEAEAFARFAGKRLPTESEWEKVASWDAAAWRKRRFPWGDDEPGGSANLGGRHLGPAAAGAYPAGSSPGGCHQLVGDVWEWTASEFRAYPGFAPFPYREYSEVFFDSGYRVLRGGSFATHPSVARATFRNWDFPIRSQIFAGFRCARDA